MSFPITCTACHKTFTISDEIYEKKVAGRVVTIKCKSCSHGIRIDGTNKGSIPAAASAAPPETASATPAEPLWAVDYPDGQDREFTTSEVLTELERGAIGGMTLVWRDGMAEWLELGQVPEFSEAFAKAEAKRKEAEAAAAVKAAAEAAVAKAAAEAAAARAAAEAAAAKAAAAAAKAALAKQSATVTPIHTPRPPMPTETGLAGLPGAAKRLPAQPAATEIKPRAKLPSSSDIAAPPRAKLPSASGLAKPRATAPSAPDLGSKPRATAPSAPDLGSKPRATAPSAPDLRPRATQPSSPGLVNPLPSAPAAATLATAAIAPTPPPIAPPIASPPAFAAAPLPFDPALPFTPPPAPKLPFTEADVTPPLPPSVAKVVSKPLPTTPAFPATPSTAPAFAAVPAIISDHATVEWPEAKSKTPIVIGGLIVVALLIGAGIFVLGGKDPIPGPTPITAAPATPATPTTTPTTPAHLPGAETASGSDPVAARDGGATPGAGFAELFAAGARKAESKGASVAPTARFDPAATKAPLAQAATEAQACKQSGGPTGKVAVVVTFDPSGKVSGATITDAPFAGTATASCIASTFKRASIPAFSGLPGTVSKTFSIL
jgi:hypothetical protein